MNKIKSPGDLQKLKETIIYKKDPGATVVAVGTATCGIAAGAKNLITALEDEISRMNLKNITVVATGCLGFCYAEPLVEVRQPGRGPIRYSNVDETLAREIVSKHIAAGVFIDNAILGREVKSQ